MKLTHCMYLISESFTSTALTILDSQEEQVSWGTVLVLIHAPVTPEQVEEIAYLVKKRADPGLRGTCRD